MSLMRCPGLPGHWVNAWLAAVGATVLDSRLRLHWTNDRTPVAVLSARDSDPMNVVIEAWPTAESLKELPVYEDWGTTGSLQRKVAVDTFVQRVREARGHPGEWTLSSTLTDLQVDKAGEVAHAPFDPAGPGSVKWLHYRLQRAHQLVETPGEDLAKCFEGSPRRVRFNGLGFDLSRLGSQTDDKAKYVDPVVELLAFFALAILPVRAEGADERLRGGAARKQVRQRGWRKIGRLDAGRRFVWPVWNMPLDLWGIDALLDTWRPDFKSDWARVGVHAAWHSVGYTARGSSDTTRGFGSSRM